MQLFNRSFDHLGEAALQDLHNLEQDGALYAQFAGDRPERSGFCRIRFRPAEMVAYVEAACAFDEFLGAQSRGLDSEEALESIKSAQIQRRVSDYNRWAEGIGQDTLYCFAAFLGPELEDLVCGGQPERYEFLAQSYSGDRRFLLTEILEMFPESSAPIQSRREGFVSFPLSCEQDVQDLLFVAIKSVLPDARMEENTPKHAGSSKRVDIVVPRIDTLVEVKYVRDASHAKGVGDELKVDFESYHTHGSCGRIIAYVWDPNREIRDRANFIEDLRGLRVKGENKFEVDVMVKP